MGGVGGGATDHAGEGKLVDFKLVDLKLLDLASLARASSSSNQGKGDVLKLLMQLEAEVVEAQIELRLSSGLGQTGGAGGSTGKCRQASLQHYAPEIETGEDVDALPPESSAIPFEHTEHNVDQSDGGLFPLVNTREPFFVVLCCCNGFVHRIVTDLIQISIPFDSSSSLCLCPSFSLSDEETYCRSNSGKNPSSSSSFNQDA